MIRSIEERQKSSWVLAFREVDFVQTTPAADKKETISEKKETVVEVKTELKRNRIPICTGVGGSVCREDSAEAARGANRAVCMGGAKVEGVEGTVADQS